MFVGNQQKNVGQSYQSPDRTRAERTQTTLPYQALFPKSSNTTKQRSHHTHSPATQVSANSTALVAGRTAAGSTTALTVSGAASAATFTQSSSPDGDDDDPGDSGAQAAASSSAAGATTETVSVAASSSPAGTAEVERWGARRNGGLRAHNCCCCEIMWTRATRNMHAKHEFWRGLQRAILRPPGNKNSKVHHVYGHQSESSRLKSSTHCRIVKLPVKMNFGAGSSAEHSDLRGIKTRKYIMSTKTCTRPMACSCTAARHAGRPEPL